MSFTVGDTAPALTGTCSNRTGTTLTAANLTGATLALHIRKPSGTVLTKTPVVVSAAAGTWSYTWQAAELSEDGVWSVEVQVTYSDTTVQTFGPEPFAVLEQIA